MQPLWFNNTSDVSTAVMAIKRPSEGMPTDEQPETKRSKPAWLPAWLPAGASFVVAEQSRERSSIAQLLAGTQQDPIILEPASKKSGDHTAAPRDDIPQDATPEDQFSEATETLISLFEGARGKVRSLRDRRKSDREEIKEVLDENEQLKKEIGTVRVANENLVAEKGRLRLAGIATMMIEKAHLKNEVKGLKTKISTLENQSERQKRNLGRKIEILRNKLTEADTEAKLAKRRQEDAEKGKRAAEKQTRDALEQYEKDKKIVEAAKKIANGWEAYAKAGEELKKVMEDSEAAKQA